MMDPVQWDRAQELFHAAADLPAKERDDFLEQACGSDRELLDNARAMIEEDARGASLLDRGISQAAQRALDAPLEQRQIGPYRLLRILGEGGMGAVYLAQREDLGNLVAMKVMRGAWLSTERRRRFEAEQRLLASLDHGSIARLFDAGALADGTPWFVMEYVEGVPLNEFCVQHKLSVEERTKLFRTVCEAVAYAHQQSIIHRDLKPSNILVKSDGAVRLLDFGIAKHLTAATLDASQTRTGMRLMTPAYAAPEQVCGGSAAPQTDVYALGVILYELLTGRLPFDLSCKTPEEAATIIVAGEPVPPSVAAGARSKRWNDLDALCLTAMEKDPARRYVSVEALIGDLDRWLNQEPLAARPRRFRSMAAAFSPRRKRVTMAAAAIMALAVLGAAWGPRLLSGVPSVKAQAKTVAVVPFRNAGAEHDLDFLGVAISDEVARSLGYERWLTVRAFSASRRYNDPPAAARELHAANVVSGTFKKIGDQLQLTLEVIAVDPSGSKRLLWQDAFLLPASDKIGLAARVSSHVRRALATLLGPPEYSWNPRLVVSGFPTESVSRPRNREAYDLYLRAMAMPEARESTPVARRMLEQSVRLDPDYAPAWAALATFCTTEAWYDNGGKAAAQCAQAAIERAAKLDPNNIWNGHSLAVQDVERQELQAAHRIAQDMVKRRPDQSDAHFVLAYVLRYAGLLEEAERECNTAMLLDPQNPGLRSCSIAFMLGGDYPRAHEFVNLDRGGEFERAITMDILVREGKKREATEAQPAAVPPWAGFPVLLAFLNRRPANEIAALARANGADSDPEMNYFSAAHLAYSGNRGAALHLLRAAVVGGYCAYPGIDSDPLLEPIRSDPEFAEIRSLARECRGRFAAGAGLAGK